MTPFFSIIIPHIIRTFYWRYYK